MVFEGVRWFSEVPRGSQRLPEVRGDFLCFVGFFNFRRGNPEGTICVSWGPPGGTLGALSGRFGGLLGCLRAILGVGRLGKVFGPSRRSLGRSRGLLGALSARVDAVLSPKKSRDNARGSPGGPRQAQEDLAILAPGP